jgi:mannosylglycoprotein endo-beta-mannosidase
LSNVAIEASVWDLEGTCPYYKVHENLSLLPKKVAPIVEMKYPKSKNPKPVYFLLLKLYNMADHTTISRNFYWLHLSGEDYKLLEPYRKKKIPLKITSKVSVDESTYNIQVNLTNTSESPSDSTILTLEYSSTSTASACGAEKEHETGWFKRIHKCFAGKTDGLKVSEINGDDVGVAFFLHLSVHASKMDYKEGEDTRILPVHYSDNYFSLVPGESMPVNISFEIPPGVTPRVSLDGWNYDGRQTIHEIV